MLFFVIKTKNIPLHEMYCVLALINLKLYHEFYI